MHENHLQPDENAGSTGETVIPPDAYLVMEGVKAIPLDKAQVSIGRSHDNSVVLDDPRVSRHHMEVRVIRGHFVLFDLNSSGGTYVNGQKTSQGILYPGDMISLAGVNMVFMQDSRLSTRDTDGFRTAGPGTRQTAIFNTSLFSKKKK